MKKLIIFGAAALMMLAATAFSFPYGLQGETPYQSVPSGKDDGYTTCKFDCKGFTDLDLSGMVKVNLVKSDKYKVEVTLPREFEEYLLVRVEGSELKIGWKKSIPTKLQKKYGDWTCEAEIAMPELRELEMSGVTSLQCNDTFDLGRGEFSLDMSGASKVAALNVNADKIEADISGACSYKVTGIFNEAELDISGAANGSFTINADRLETEVSGAGKTTIDGSFGKADIEVSGGCELRLKGKVGTLKADASGAAKLKAMGIVAQEAFLQTSGAAICEVNVTRSIVINDATGVSKIRYKAPENVNATLRSKGTASVERVN